MHSTTKPLSYAPLDLTMSYDLSSCVYQELRQYQFRGDTIWFIVLGVKELEKIGIIDILATLIVEQILTWKSFACFASNLKD